MEYKKPDRKNAESMLEAAEQEFKATIQLPVTTQNAFMIIRNIYECFRMMGDVRLLNQGKKTKEHTEHIQALITLPINTPRPLTLLENLRKLRHGINYYGYLPSQIEAEETLTFGKACFYLVKEAILKELH